MTKIRLVISDVDGTLVTRDKRLTAASLAAVSDLQANGILFSITSSRPAFGMKAVATALKIQLPLGPFNGSSLVNSDLSVIEQHLIPRAAVVQSLQLFEQNKIDVWVFTNRDWVILRDDGKYVPHERNTIATTPILAKDLAPYFDTACKLVGVSGDFKLLERCESELQAELGTTAHAVRSQDYYLDVTPPGFDKGTFVEAMGKRLDISRDAIATLGDMPNDVPMFGKSSVSFAMGNASDAVKAHASHVTASNEDDGFSKAIQQILQMTN